MVLGRSAGHCGRHDRAPDVVGLVIDDRLPRIVEGLEDDVDTLFFVFTIEFRETVVVEPVSKPLQDGEHAS